MLKVFRNKNVAKMVLWGILILTLPAFVLWGSGSIGGSGKKGPTYVGTIENKKISFDDFAGSLESIRCQVVLNYYNDSKTLDKILKNKEFLGKLAWDRLIMFIKAKEAGISVSDREVVAFIGSHPLFVRNGAFDDRTYEYFLRNSLGLMPRSFEELIRENLMIQKLTDMLTEGVKVSDEEALRDYKKENDKFTISYVVISAKKGDKDRAAAIENAKKVYDKLVEKMTKNKLSFEKACSKLDLKAQESKPFIGSDFIEGIGRMRRVAELAETMKKDELSKPVEIQKGILIFKVSSIQPFDQEKFKKDKDDYIKKILINKKNAYMENWLREREKEAALQIDLGNYEKYYK